ncbi:MAG TPA: histidinol dehydrogenase [Clostridiaceae bacterium]|nr:histidinol dehydrogenase [Clostridiaceae bacterium]
MIKVYDVRNGAGDEFYKMLSGRNVKESPEITRMVSEILENVNQNGDKAVLQYTEMFDGVALTEDEIKVSQREIDAACREVDEALLATIKKAADNIREFHMKQKENSWFSTEKDGVILGQLYRPLEKVGVYVPGGTAAYPSSVLMNVIPAKVADVAKIIMVTPPGKDKSLNPVILAAAREAGVDEIYRVGGAQAIAAMAFGTGIIPRVDKIVGPGNIYVATAKRMVYGYCDIDMVAGPSEIAVVADDSANPAYVAADLLSQAEHDVLASSILVTTCERLAEEVVKEIGRQCGYLSRKDIIRKSLDSYGAIIIAGSVKEAVDIVNNIAPEHLELCVREPFSLLGEIKNAGAIFLGLYSSEPLGDYFAGPNHVLPTGGTARFFSPLNTGDFLKKSSVISYSREALEKVKDDIIRFAEAEGLTAHANAIQVRWSDGSCKCNSGEVG